MKNWFFKHLIILVLVFSFGSLLAQPQDFFLKNKNYLNHFSNNDVQELNSAFSQKSNTDKNWQKYQKLSNDAQQYKNLAKNYAYNPRRKNKFLKKQNKLQKKAAKFQIKALNSYLLANSIIRNKYQTKISTLTTSDAKLLDTLRDMQIVYTDSARNSKNNSSSDPKIQAQKMQAQYKFENKAILFMEYQLALFAGDSSVIKPLKQKYFPPVKKTVVVSDTVPQWDYRNDEMFFYPLNEDVDSKILYVPDDFSDLDRYFNIGKSAYLDMYSTNNIYDSVKFYQNKLLQIKDYRKRYNVSTKISNLQTKALGIEITAVNNYFVANELFFQTRMRRIYDNPMPDTSTTTYKKILEYIYKSELFFLDADSSYKYSLKMGSIDKYNSLDRGNQQLITALEYLENAFCLKFNYDTINVMVKNKPLSMYDLQPTIVKDNADTTKTTNNNKTTNKTTNKTVNNNTSKSHKISGLFQYSYNNRTPVLSTTPNGEIYRVQVGTSVDLLPVNELKEFDKIYFEQSTNTDLKKFLVGDYTNYSDAQSTLNSLKAKGYRTAVIVKYVDGRRQGASYSTNYGTGNGGSSTTSSSSGFKNVSQLRVLTYLIQLGTYSTPKTKADLANYQNIYQRQLANGDYQYFQGIYFRYNQAETALPNVIQKGFTDAKIVAFNAGKETTIETALRIEGVTQTTTNNNQTNNNTDVIFRVQVGAFSDYLSNTQLSQHFSSLNNNYTFHTHQKNGLIVYSVGNVRTYQEAKAIKQDVASKGFTDCYVISFKGNVQVPLSDVVN